MREVLGSFVGRQFLDHSVFTVLAFQGNIVLIILRLMCSKKIMISVMIVVINIVFLKKFILLNLKMDFFCLSLIFVLIGSHFLQS